MQILKIKIPGQNLSGIRFCFKMSGFSKSTYLESTRYGDFPDAKIFPDKICPGSGFVRMKIATLPLIQVLMKQAASKIAQIKIFTFLVEAIKSNDFD